MAATGVAVGAILVWMIPAGAQSLTPDSPIGPVEPVRQAALAPVETPTLLPVISVVAGLTVLTLTLASIVLRRRAELMPIAVADFEQLSEILPVPAEAEFDLVPRAAPLR